MIKGGSVYYYSQDGLGSAVNLTDTNGNVIESYSYDEYGNLTSSPSQVDNRYLYTGREYDSEAGLYYYRARYYDPTIGRFLQTDPIGYYGGINLYTYVGNNPINHFDPYGLDPDKDLEELKEFLKGLIPPYPQPPEAKPQDPYPTPHAEAAKDLVRDMIDYFGNQPPGVGGEFQPFLDAATLLDKFLDWCESQNW